MANSFHSPSPSLLAIHAPLSPVQDNPTLVAHQSDDVFALWMAWEKETGQIQDVPYWAIVWPAAQVLAKYIACNPTLVLNNRILDLGCGGGIAGLAALKEGAKSVLANDIDSTALGISELNATANRLKLQLKNQNLLDSPPETNLDLILVGDMFYDKTVSNLTLKWLTLARKQGSRVIIADAARPFAPKEDVDILHAETVSTHLDLEGRTERRVQILAYQP